MTINIVEGLLGSLNRVKQQIKNLRFDSQEYWRGRVKKFGKRAVINAHYPAEQFDAITARDRNMSFPYLQKLLKGDDKVVLDFGCGAGRFTADLADLVHGTAIGVDPMEDLIAMAPGDSDVTFKVIREDRIPVDDASVDVVWIYVVLGCLRGNLLKKTLSEINRVLKKGGLVFLVENTTVKDALPHHTYRQFEEYRKLFSFVSLERLNDFADVGDCFNERFSVMAGRKI